MSTDAGRGPGGVVLLEAAGSEEDEVTVLGVGPEVWV